MLVVVRTVTTATRLLDVLDLLCEDARVQIVFTFEQSSAFTTGVTGFIDAIGGLLLPWDQAVRHRFDIAICASENGALHQLQAPLILLPHGAGHNKFSKSSNNISGYNPQQLIHHGTVVPQVIVLSHGEQLDQLAASCSEAVPHAVVAGDICFERLRSSTPHRARYRKALGLGDSQRLVVVSSTWGTRSAFGRDHELVQRLLTALPRDEYRVALVLHPSIWFGHSPYAVRGWLRSALDAGLLLVPPHEGWRATLVAADLLISDHGSISLYGAAVGVAVLLAAFDHDEVVPGTPMAALADKAVALDAHSDLRSQIDTAMAAHDQQALELVASRVFGRAGAGAGFLRSLLYDVMALPEPAGPATARPVDEPSAEERRMQAHLVSTTLIDDHTVELERFPATLPSASAPGRDQHIAVEDDVFDTALADSAAVVLARDAPADVLSWARQVLADRPAARVVAAKNLIVLRRDGRVLQMTAEPAAEPADDLAVAASAVCALTARRPEFAGGMMTIKLGGRTLQVRLTEFTDRGSPVSR
ncbi:hypothetical protein [Lentzea pudingi]|uniref:hypothetical protein n=1 Tax=Lentzea pudingi TaxID=1789439 RepID=UPI001667AB76|nr:hypothetical protein [Lentzea pudingi]